MNSKENAAGWNQAAHQKTQCDYNDSSKEKEAKNKHQNPSDGEVEIICMNTVEMKPIDWLWPHRIARGKLTVIAGEPGLGKSQLVINIAVTITKGAVWPETLEPAPCGHVVFLSAEDDPADTIKPRLLAADADINRCHILQAVKIRAPDGKDSRRCFNLKHDVEQLGHAIAKIGDVKLVVIDPISAYLGDTDSHKNAEMRELLMALAAMAAQYGVAIILITHLSKDEKKSIMGRVMGSIAMIAAARAGYAVIKDSKNPDTRYFLPIKNNIGNDKDGFSFQIENVELAEGITTSKIYWLAGLVDAHSILHPKAEEKPTATNSATDWLRTLLCKPVSATTVFSEAEGAGFSKAVIQRAANRIGIHRKKLGMGGGWEWKLPVTSTYYTKGREDSEGGRIL